MLSNSSRRKLNSLFVDVEFLTQKEIGLKRVRLDKSCHVNKQNQAALRASYMVALRIAEEKCPHTIAEKLVLPCCKDIVRCLIRDVKEKKLNCVPLSNDTVQRLIYDISDDIEQQVVAEIRGAPLNKFAIELDKSTDVPSCAHARYIKDGDFKEEFLFCHCLESTTRGEDVFNEVSEYFRKRGLSWDNVSACTTDGVPAMLGNRSGFRARVKAVNPNTKHIHCMIHRYALAAKTLPPELKATLEDVIHMVNCIKSSVLNTRLFRLLCQEFDDDQEALLFHTEVR